MLYRQNSCFCHAHNEKPFDCLATLQTHFAGYLVKCAE